MRDLLPERVQRGKVLLRTEHFIQPDVQRAAVDRAVKIEKIGLQNRCGKAPGRGVDADVHDRVVAVSVQLRAGGVDAVRRNEDIRLKGEIGGREAERMPEVAAMRDDAGDEVRMAEIAALLEKFKESGLAFDDLLVRKVVDGRESAAPAPQRRGRAARG